MLAGYETWPHGPNWVSGTEPTVLDRIHEPDIHFALWERPQTHALVRDLAALPPPLLPCGRVLVSVVDAPACLRTLMRPLLGTREATGDALLADMVGLVRQFAELTGENLIDIRVDRLQHDACWKFHRDHVRLRLLTTYRGPATQVVPPEAADAALRQQRAYHGPVQELPPGSVALFKGTRMAPEAGIVHRSPPVAGTGVTRLLLCLNLPSDTSPPHWSAPEAE